MADPVSPFRLAFVDHKADYRMNLQFCCDHYRSVSEVCRRIAINRQQFNRYLAGSAIPSRHNHKLITDFKYFHTYLGEKRIKRELVHWYYEGDVLVSSVKQRYLGEDEQGNAALRFITYRGVVGNLGDRLIVVDHHRGTCREASAMLLYPKGRLLKRLSGMTLGVSHGSARSIAAARVVMDFLGAEIDIRAALGRLGVFGLDEPTVPEGVRRAVRNDIQAEETLFIAR